MQILSKILPYNNTAKPEYKYRVFFTDGLKKSYKVFKLKSLAVEFIKTAKEWNKGTSTPVLDVTDNNNTSNNIAPLPIAKSAVSKYQSIERICKEYNTTIEEILSFYVKFKEKLSDITLKKAVGKFLCYINTSDFSECHKTDISAVLNRFYVIAPDCIVYTIETKLIEDWLNTRKKHKTFKGGELVEKDNISATTYNDYLSYINTFFNWCIKNGYSNTNPAKNINKKKKKEEDVKFYSYYECKEILGASSGYTKFYIAFALFTGIRRAEIFRIKWSDIHLEDREIVLSAAITKTNQRRIVKIPENLVKYIEPYYKEENKGYVFTMGDAAMRCRTKRLFKTLSFPSIQNGFRHTGASFYLAKTQNEYETARQLGHSVEILKRHYAGLVRQSEAVKFWQL